MEFVQAVTSKESNNYDHLHRRVINRIGECPQLCVFRNKLYKRRCSEFFTSNSTSGRIFFDKTFADAMLVLL